jgi:hypothetical protein
MAPLIRPESVNIKSPLILPYKQESNPIRVTCVSRKPYRKAVWRMACFFRRELYYDIVQYGYEGEEDDPTCVAFLWVHPEAVGRTMLSIPCIGAACFRFRVYSDRPARNALQWVWFHPFYRRRGLLSASWPDFKSEFGDFECEHPLSTAMEAFVEKHQHC